VPLFAANFTQKSLDEAIESEGFDQVADVLNALQEHDEDLLDMIRELRERKGAGEPFDLRRLPEKVEIIGPAVDLERLNTSISIAVVDRIGISWDEWYGRLKAYTQREGHCRVPQGYCDSSSGYRLGSWVSDQRKYKEILSPERRQRLDALGFVWHKLEAQWEEGFRCLEHYRREKGDCRVPDRYRDPASGFRLGQWIGVQRKTQATMSPERRARLDALGFVWDALTTQWEEGFRCLELFRQREGHCRVPDRYRDLTSGFRLGQWVGVQRKTQATMSPDRRARLNALEFVWDILEGQWEEGFRFLQLYHQREGHCRVPVDYRKQEFRLGIWVSNQRNNPTMSPDRRARLDALGFAWDALTSRWEEGFRCLELFQRREGHCRVPTDHRDPTSGYRLGQWVSDQRAKQVTISPERRQRLDALGFVWNTLAASWEEGFRFLELFCQREGHCRVPDKHREQGYRLGAWVSNQRTAQDKLAPDRRARLDALGFVWKVRS
jgi:hypothetical protein